MNSGNVDWAHPVAGYCKHGNEPSSSIKVGEFLYKLNDYKKTYVQWSMCMLASSLKTAILSVKSEG
jgi:hypothetical protein